MGKGTAEPCIGTIYFPSVLTWGRMRQVSLKIELKMTLLRLQCHLWTVVLRVVQTSLLQLDAGIQTTRGQLPWRYRNFGLLMDTRPTNIRDVKVDPHACLHILLWLYNTFKWGAVWTTLCWSQTMHIEHRSLSIQGDTLNVTFMCGFLGREGSGLKDIWSSCNSPTIKKLKKDPMGERGESRLHPR